MTFVAHKLCPDARRKAALYLVRGACLSCARLKSEVQLYTLPRIYKVPFARIDDILGF